MSNAFESNFGSSLNSNNRSESSSLRGDAFSQDVANDPVAPYRNERWIPTAAQTSASQTELEKLGYGTLELGFDSQLVSDVKARVKSSESQQEQSYQFVDRDASGKLALGPYKLSGDSILSWISNVTPEEMSALSNTPEAASFSVRAIAGLNMLAQAYKQGLSPDQARQQLAEVVSDPDVQKFMTALRAMQSGAEQVSGEQLSAVFTPELQELIAGDMIRAASNTDAATRQTAEQKQPPGDVISQRPVTVPDAADPANPPAAAAKASGDAKILPGPLQKVDSIS